MTKVNKTSIRLILMRQTQQMPIGRTYKKMMSKNTIMTKMVMILMTKMMRKKVKQNKLQQKIRLKRRSKLVQRDQKNEMLKLP